MLNHLLSIYIIVAVLSFVGYAHPRHRAKTFGDIIPISIVSSVAWPLVLLFFVFSVVGHAIYWKKWEEDDASKNIR